MNPGDLVLCVDDSKFHPGYGERLPRRGVVYTIREVALEYPDCIRLEEIRNPPYRYIQGYAECTFRCIHFRPIDSDQLSIFRKHLTDIPAPREAEEV